jgi:hypothetical protein
MKSRSNGFESASRAIRAKVETNRSKSDPGFGSLKTATPQDTWPDKGCAWLQDDSVSKLKARLLF